MVSNDFDEYYSQSEDEEEEDFEEEEEEEEDDDEEDDSFVTTAFDQSVEFAKKNQKGRTRRRNIYIALAWLDFFYIALFYLVHQSETRFLQTLLDINIFLFVLLVVITPGALVTVIIVEWRMSQKVETREKVKGITGIYKSLNQEAAYRGLKKDHLMKQIRASLERKGGL